MIEEELPDVPLYYLADKLASKVSLSTIKMVKFRSAILNAGYRVSMSHAHKNSIKTDAPPQVLWDILRTWDKLNPTNYTKTTKNEIAKIILEAESKTVISFDLHPEADPNSKKLNLLRFQKNPERNWGPKQRSKTSILFNSMEEKKEKNQGKKKRKISSNNEETKKPKEDS